MNFGGIKMSDLAATNCGGCGDCNGFGGSSCYWIIILLLLCSSCGNGMNVRGESNDKEDFNRIVEASQIVFNRKMYLYPMPDSEMRKTKNLVQNPGW